MDKLKFITIIFGILTEFILRLVSLVPLIRKRKEIAAEKNKENETDVVD